MAGLPPPTIQFQKQSFINDQTRLLSQPLAPSRSWRAGNSATATAPLTDKAVDDALVRLNHRLHQHARRVYNPAATRHVAEQLEQLCLREGGGAAAAAASSVRLSDDGAIEGEEGISHGADLANAETISSLPGTWPSPRDAESLPMEARRYEDLVSSLHALSARRDAVAVRVDRLRAMREGLAPFSRQQQGSPPTRSSTEGGGGGGGSSNSIQKNLVTRDGELERELDRMRILMARVGDRVARLDGEDNDSASGGSLFRDGGGDMIVDLEDEGRRKVAELLEKF